MIRLRLERTWLFVFSTLFFITIIAARSYNNAAWSRLVAAQYTSAPASLSANNA